MIRSGVELAGGAIFEHCVKKVVDARHAPSESVSEEQKEFDRQVRMAQNVLGFLCPPAGTAMFAMEYGSIVAADLIQSDAAKSLGRWIKSKISDCELIKSTLGYN